MIGDREDILLHMPVISKLVRGKKVILEIAPDTGNGSTRAIANGISSEAIWISVDITDHIMEELRPTFSNWHMVVGDSREATTANKVKEILGNRKADFIFIDTIHDKGFLAKELGVWAELATPDTLWAFHDTWISGQYNPMTDAAKEFAQQFPQWEYRDLSTECNGFGALIPVGMDVGDPYENSDNS